MTKILTSALMLAPAAALADGGYSGFGHMGYGHMSGIGGFGMFMGMGLFWVALLLVGAWLFTRQNSTGNKDRTESVAIDLVKQRYAKGDIDEAEMQELIDKLKSTS